MTQRMTLTMWIYERRGTRLWSGAARLIETLMRRSETESDLNQTRE